MVGLLMFLAVLVLAVSGAVVLAAAVLLLLDLAVVDLALLDREPGRRFWPLSLSCGSVREQEHFVTGRRSRSCASLWKIGE